PSTIWNWPESDGAFRFHALKPLPPAELRQIPSAVGSLHSHAFPANRSFLASHEDPSPPEILSPQAPHVSRHSSSHPDPDQDRLATRQDDREHRRVPGADATRYTPGSQSTRDQLRHR